MTKHLAIYFIIIHTCPHSQMQMFMQAKLVKNYITSKHLAKKCTPTPDAVRFNAVYGMRTCPSPSMSHL